MRTLWRINNIRGHYFTKYSPGVQVPEQCPCKKASPIPGCEAVWELCYQLRPHCMKKCKKCKKPSESWVPLPEPWIPGRRVLHPGDAWSQLPALPSLDVWEQWAAATGRHCCRAAPLSHRQQAGEMCWSPCTAGQCCWRADIRNGTGRSEIATLLLKEWNGWKVKRFG